MPKLILYSRQYTVKNFKTDKGVNKFLESNNEYGVIHVKQKPYTVSVARNTDKGKPIKKIN